VQNVVVNGDHSPLNLSLGGATNRQSPSKLRDVIDEKPEVTRRRKAELMTSLRLTDCSNAGRCVESPTPEVEMSTNWNGNHLLYEPPPIKRQRTDDDTDEGEDSEEALKKGRSSLLSVLAVGSFTDVYNAYQRRQARLQLEVHSSAGNEIDCVTGSGLAAEVDEQAADIAPGADRTSSTPTWDSGVVPAEGALTNVAPPTDNGVYPLAARYASQLSLL